MRDMAMMRIRSQHPELDERGVLDQLMWELYGVRRITELGLQELWQKANQLAV